MRFGKWFGFRFDWVKKRKEHKEGGKGEGKGKEFGGGEGASE